LGLGRKRSIQKGEWAGANNIDLINYSKTGRETLNKWLENRDELQGREKNYTAQGPPTPCSRHRNPNAIKGEYEKNIKSTNKKRPCLRKGTWRTQLGWKDSKRKIKMIEERRNERLNRDRCKVCDTTKLGKNSP